MGIYFRLTAQEKKLFETLEKRIQKEKGFKYGRKQIFIAMMTRALTQDIKKIFLMNRGGGVGICGSHLFLFVSFFDLFVKKYTNMVN